MDHNYSTFNILDKVNSMQAFQIIALLVFCKLGSTCVKGQDLPSLLAPSGLALYSELHSLLYPYARHRYDLHDPFVSARALIYTYATRISGLERNPNKIQINMRRSKMHMRDSYHQTSKHHACHEFGSRGVGLLSRGEWCQEENIQLKEC